MLSALKYELLTALMAALPIIEVRGAIPFGVSQGLRPGVALLCAILGSMLPAPFVIILLRHLLQFFRDRGIFPRAVNWLETHLRRKSSAVQRYSLPALFLLVAVPLPGTGVWTGSMVASLLNMRCRRALPVILIGTTVASLIMAALSYGFAALI